MSIVAIITSRSRFVCFENNFLKLRFFIGFWNCTNSVAFFAFQFITGIILYMYKSIRYSNYFYYYYFFFIIFFFLLLRFFHSSTTNTITELDYEKHRKRFIRQGTTRLTLVFLLLCSCVAHHFSFLLRCFVLACLISSIQTFACSTPYTPIPHEK